MPETNIIPSLTLSHECGANDGTFGLTAAFMLRDLLTDNDPVVITWTTDEGVRQTSTLHRINDHTLVTDIGTFDLAHVASIEVE